MISLPFRKLLANSQGNSTVELALVTPVLLTLALGGIDVAMGFTHKMQMQHYAQVGADYVVATIESSPSAATVRQEVQASSGLSLGKITVNEWAECDGVKNPIDIECPSAAAVQYNFMEIVVTDNYEPILAIPGFADFVVSTRNTGSATVRTM